MFWKKKENHIEKKVHHLHSAVINSFSNVKKDTENIFQWLNYFHQKNQYQEQFLRTQEQTIRELKTELKQMPVSSEEIKKVIDEYYSFEHIFKRIKEIDDRISELARLQYEQLERYSKKHEERITEVSKRHEEGLRELSKKHEESISGVLKKHEESLTQLSKSPVHIAIPQEKDLGSHELNSLRSRLEKLEQKKALMKEKIISRITKNSKDYVKSIILSYIKKYERISSLQLKDMIVEEQGLTSKSSFYRIMEEIEESGEVGVIRRGNEKHYISKLVNKL